MLEAKLQSASVFKRIFEAIKDMCTDVNLDCDSDGIKLQSMDTSHVALVSLELKASGFDSYRCDRGRALGLNLPTVCKVFKLCNPNDACLIQCADEGAGDMVTFVFENSEDDKLATFNLRLMTIENESLGIPEDSTDVNIVMSSKEFVNTIKNLSDFR
eukprot:GHVT01025512.1.p1 GENE.GHVT01025512.1~~GHVT01025512.1.p1  ORF type:complete len:158 (+),score=10.58 GHVT01025512.1:242-715(+)